MSGTSTTVHVYLEIGKQRTVAGAIDWPGWCRIGRDEAAALEALVAYGPRYARVLHAAGLAFQAPADVTACGVVERLVGNASTDFGVPDIAPSRDALPIDAPELERFQALLQAYWRAFDAAAQAAVGKELRKGPCGGGRDLHGIIRHVLGADVSYLARLGRQVRLNDDADLRQELDRVRQATLDALAMAARGEMPARGPRGGARWAPRYFVRRAGWHVLDHAWEIEDRIV